MGAVTHDIVGHIENPFMDTFRDRYGNINIHGDRDNIANERATARCNGDCSMQENVEEKSQGNLRGNIDAQGQGHVNAKSNVNANTNAKLNGNAGLNFKLNFGLRRANAKQSSHTIFVPIENLSNFGYPTRYAVYCMRKNIYE